MVSNNFSRKVQRCETFIFAVFLLFARQIVDGGVVVTVQGKNGLQQKKFKPVGSWLLIPPSMLARSVSNGTDPTLLSCTLGQSIATSLPTM